MDNKKILLVNLSKGKVGEGNANLIGSLLITKIYLAAMSRADAGPYELDKLPPFYFYVDEFQNFANESFASILSEARKYNLALTVAHQYVEQMEDEVKSAVFGNVGTMIVFRVGATDGEVFEKEFAPVFTMDDIVNLSAYQIYLRLMIDGAGSKPFSATTLDPISKPVVSYTQAVLSYSRLTHGKPRFVVEDEIAAFYAPIIPEKKEKKEVIDNSQQGDVTKKSQPHPHKEDNTQKLLKVRKIRDDTPLPPKVFPKKDTQDRAYDTYDRVRSVEESFHTPPTKKEERHHKERQYNKDEKKVSKIDVPLFDSKPAISLKDALTKAMDDFKGEEVSKAKVNDESTNGGNHASKQIKEVDKEVLYKLLNEE
jgi:hypothetical protein